MAKEMNKIDYGKFQTVREMLKSCDFESQDERQKAFESLVRCLVDKHVYRIDGTLVRDREKCIEYLILICPMLEDSELDLMLTKPGEFYDKFVFAPNKGGMSLFWEYKEPTLMSKYEDVPLISKYEDVPDDEIFDCYRQATGCSPYEKISKKVLEGFLLEEGPMYD